MGKTYRRVKTESHKRKINSKATRRQDVNTYEEFDGSTFQIRLEATGDDRCETSKDCEEDN